jgi:Domain of unknown function (DUF4232)
VRIITRAGIAGISLTAGLALTACGSSGSSASSSSSQTPSAPASPAATAAAGTPGASTPAAPGSPSGAAAGNCQPTGLRVALGAHSGTSQVTQTVDLTNTSSSPCRLDGFAGVNLFGTAQGKSDYQWPLTRSAQSYSAVTVQPGATAHFNLVYLPAQAGDTVIHVTKVIVTPPNDFSSVNVPWTQDILLQDAATHPGTWITPVQSGA